jgi:hypothetical protein
MVADCFGETKDIEMKTTSHKMLWLACTAIALLVAANGAFARIGRGTDVSNPTGPDDPVVGDRPTVMFSDVDHTKALHNGACWQYRLVAARWKRVYVCD